MLVDPTTSVWVDLVVPIGGAGPASEPAALYRWVGAAWLGALQRLGVGGLAVHDGRPTGGDRARLLCFAGVGTGEVVQRTPDGPSKVVGLSQRRTRGTARVQGLFVSSWDPDAHRDVVRRSAWGEGFDPADVRAGLAGGGAVPSPDRVVAAILASLPAAPGEAAAPGP